LTELLYLEGRRGALDALLLLHAESAATPDDAERRAMLGFVDTAPTPSFPLRAADLLQRGVLRGRELGAALKRLQAAWIRAGFPTDPRRVLTLLEDAIRADAE
jgi:poly(A) polymerase